MSIVRFKRLIKKKWFRLRLAQLAFGWAAFVLAVSVAAAALFAGKADAHDPDEAVYYKYYKNVRVERGDSLWKYAEEYRKTDEQSCREYIDEVRSINHLEGDNIVAGENIVLPYYSTVYVCSVD